MSNRFNTQEKNSMTNSFFDNESLNFHNDAEDINEERIARETLERYSGSDVTQFRSYLLLTNFSHYIRVFAEMCQIPINEGSMFTTAHSVELDISILDFRLGSPSAALTVDLCSFLPTTKAALMLGMCGGLRKHYSIGDYFVPVASIRGEGTSNAYFSPEVPALANFVVQKVTTEVLDQAHARYHIGITHTTNIRFWEFNKAFRKQLYDTKAQVAEMECATLFAAGYKRNLPIGALLLISDLPFRKEGIKTKESGNYVLKNYSKDHIQKGIEIIKALSQIVIQKSSETPDKKGDLPHMEIGETEDPLSSL